MNYYLTVLKKYAVCSGRARRAEYWYFLLFDVIIYFALSIISIVVISGSYNILGNLNSLTNNILGTLYSLAILIPFLAVSIRRLHDIGKSGWMVLLSAIPIVNIWFYILMMIDSNPGENKYGPNPKGVSAK